MIVLADASPLITLAKIGHLDLLPSLYGSVIVTPEVYGEVVVSGAGLPGAAQVAKEPWIEVKPITDRSKFASNRLRIRLDLGELSLLALAREIQASLAIIDDRQARRQATAEGLPIIGSLGVLVVAFRTGRLDNLAEACRKLLDSDAYVSKKMIDGVLSRLSQPRI